MSKANQKFVQADEAVSPVIGVILMVAITVVLAAVVFVLVSNLSKTSDKAEDAAFKADSYPLLTTTGGIQITMIRMGVNGPYDPSTLSTGTTADDVLVNVDGVTCAWDGTATTGEYTGNFGSDGLWGAGETIRINGACDGTTAPASTSFSSSTEHQVQVTVRGTVVFEGKVVIN